MPNRTYVIIDASDVADVDFSQVLETSEYTLRWSRDGTQTFVKFEGETPSFLDGMAQYNLQEIHAILDCPEWSWPRENVPVLITPISATTTTTGDLWPVSNLVQGCGFGVEGQDPYGQLGSRESSRWVTGAPGGVSSNFIAAAGEPVLTFDLGSDTPIYWIHIWGYSITNADGVQDFSLSFATDAEGTDGFGTSITSNPLLSLLIDDASMQTYGFGAVTARYVEMTVHSNYFSNGGFGPPAGGDRVGLGEVAFSIPEPSSVLLGFLGLVGLAFRRRR
jgi:hypothetical protein